MPETVIDDALTNPRLEEAREMAEFGLRQCGVEELPGVATALVQCEDRWSKRVIFELKYDPDDRSTWMLADCTLTGDGTDSPDDVIWTPLAVTISYPHADVPSSTHRFWPAASAAKPPRYPNG